MTPFPRRCETCDLFTWDGSGDGGACHLSAVRAATPVRPEQSCPQWTANTTILTAEIHRLKSSEWEAKRLTLRMADRLADASEVLGKVAERRAKVALIEWTEGGGI